MFRVFPGLLGHAANEGKTRTAIYFGMWKEIKKTGRPSRPQSILRARPRMEICKALANSWLISRIYREELFAFSIVNCRESAARRSSLVPVFIDLDKLVEPALLAFQNICSRFSRPPWARGQRGKTRTAIYFECEKRSKRQADRAGRKAFYEPEFTYGNMQKLLANSWLISRIYREELFAFSIVNCRESAARRSSLVPVFIDLDKLVEPALLAFQNRCSRFSRPPWARGQRGKNANSNLFWNVKRDQKDRPTEQAAKHSTSPTTYGKYAKFRKFLIDIKNLSRRAFCIFHSELPRIGGSKKLARACFYWSWQIGWASILAFQNIDVRVFPGLLGHAANEGKTRTAIYFGMWKEIKKTGRPSRPQSILRARIHVWKICKVSRKFLIDIKNLSRRAFCIFHSELPRIGGSKKLARACFYWSWQIGWASITRIPKYRCSRFSRPPWARGQRGKNANSNLFWNVKRDQKDRPTEQAAKHSTSPTTYGNMQSFSQILDWYQEFIAKSFLHFP